MMKIDSIESVSISTNKKGRGRLARSLEFTTKSKSKSKSNYQTKTQAIDSSIWRDPIKNVLPHSTGFTAHKMSSVTNNFMSSDNFNDYDDVNGGEIETSEIEEIVEDLDPGRGALVFLQHDEVFRTSPLSSSNSFEYQENDNYNDDNNENENDSLAFDNYPIDSTSTGTSNGNDNGTGILISNTESNNSIGEIGMSWNPKQNRWIPLIYRYVFPSSAFSVATKSLRINNNDDTAWSLKTGKNHYNSSSSRSYSFKFPPPQKSIMMGPNGLLINSEKEAREACEQLLDLIDDKNLAIPLQNSHVVDDNNNICPRACASNAKPLNSSISNPNATGRSILSEWSSLPSSPPPPIFHDVCNRPIPELRLSPPMTGKSIGKRLFQTTISNSPCESPLTKRLRFSSSSSSIS